ncbi:Terminal uridylyltransferase 4 [Varanus komodoensis]|nr:Terminal uridylyltransferase 4 [Varanus komodoensis]
MVAAKCCFGIRRVALSGSDADEIINFVVYELAVMAQHNTRMLATYAAIDPRVQYLGYTMKVFAKRCDIGDASRGSLSSYAYILMVLYFLQQREPPVIPVLQEIFDGQQIPQRMVDGWNAFFFDDTDELKKRLPSLGKNTESLGELWLGLLRFYTEEFDFKEYVISIRQKKLLTTFEKQWTSKCIAIEDPFDLNHNLGAGVSRKRTWNVRSMNQGKLDVVNQEMTRLNIDILGISELKWTGMGEFNSDDHQLKLKKVGKSTRPLKYDLNHIPDEYTVAVTNRFKELDLIDRVPEELWMEVHNIVQEVATKAIPKKKKCKKAKWLSEEALQIAEERREVKGKGERYTQLNAEFQRIARREHIMGNAGLCESPVGIKIAGRNINNLRYADDTTVKWQKITADGDCSQEIKRRLLLGRKAMSNLDSILKSRDITLPTKVCIVKAMVFPFAMPDPEDETQILWPPNEKEGLPGEEPNAGNNRWQKKKGTAEDEVAGWSH